MIQDSIFSDVFKQYIREIVQQVVREEVANTMKDLLQAQENQTLLSVSEACKLFYPAITRQTLASYSDRHQLPKQVIGRRVYYKRGDVLNVARSINKLKAA